MRYAFATSPQRTTWDWLLEVWRIADELPAFESGWTFDHLYPIMGDSVATFTECRRVLSNACARIDRDPSEITCSALVRYEGDTDAMRRTIDDLDAAGTDLVIISIRKSDPPDTIARVMPGLD